MQKKRNRILHKILASGAVCVVGVCLALTFAGCSKIEDDENYVEENGWMAMKNSDITVRLIGVKDEMGEKEEWVVPTEIRGYTVVSIDSRQFSTYFNIGPNKIFVPGVNYYFPGDSHGFPIAKEKMIFLSAAAEDYSHGFKLKNDMAYNYPYYYFGQFYIPAASKAAYADLYREYNDVTFIEANVSYYYNYEDSPNQGYCWVDDLDEGQKIQTKPDDPIREGYTFCGWYTDSEGANTFDSDIYTKGEDKLELYAKWIQNN
jgi:uncharacterized repeat protein (TIGR02543 family)